MKPHQTFRLCRAKPIRRIVKHTWINRSQSEANQHQADEHRRGDWDEEEDASDKGEYLSHPNHLFVRETEREESAHKPSNCDTTVVDGHPCRSRRNGKLFHLHKITARP